MLICFKNTAGKATAGVPPAVTPAPTKQQMAPHKWSKFGSGTDTYQSSVKKLRTINNQASPHHEKLQINVDIITSAAVNNDCSQQQTK